MDRQIVYPAQIPLDSDQLNAQRNAYVGMGHLAGMAYGQATVSASGFACVPGTGLALIVAPGSLIAPGVVDASSYGTLAAVQSALVRQYISRDPVTLDVPGAGAVYIVYVSPVTQDADDTVLPFYNAANPSVTYAGSDNSGATAPTVRQDLAQLGIGASVPAGAYPLWTVTVPAGASAITADMLTQAADAPFYDTIPQLQAAKQDALGFTPVQQGGGTNQTTDKVNIGQDSTYSGLLRVAISGVDKGNLLSGTWGATITGLTGDLPGLGLWFQHATQRPAFAYQTADGDSTIIDLPNQADVQTVQTNLTAFQTAQTTENATLSADISNCVSGVYGKSSADYQILGLYQQGSTGRPVVVFNDGTTTVYKGIANYADVTTLQTSLATFQTQQSDQNSTFSSEIAARVPTNATNDGTNAPITLMNFFLGTGILWFTANGEQYNVAQTNPGTGWNAIKNITVEDDSGALTVLDTTGTTNTYAPCSADSEDSYDAMVVGNMRFLSFTTTAYDGQVINYPIAFSGTPKAPVITSSESQDGSAESVVANINKGSVTETGFTAHLARISGSDQYGIPSTQPITLTVLVMGPK